MCYFSYYVPSVARVSEHQHTAAELNGEIIDKKGTEGNTNIHIYHD